MLDITSPGHANRVAKSKEFKTKHSFISNSKTRQNKAPGL